MRVFLSLFLMSCVAVAAPDEDQNKADRGPAWICVVIPEEAPAVLDEAHHRVIAELRAVGFGVRTVEPRAHPEAIARASDRCSGASGILVLEQVGTELTILASAPGEDPLQQRMDLNRGRTNAEVIAIRAVEGLRAALIQSMRNAEAPPDESPAAVRDFTHLGTPPEGSQWAGQGSELTPEEATLRRRRRARGAGKAGPEFPLLLGLGPGLSYDGGSPGAAIELLAMWRPGILSLGAVLDATLAAGGFGLPGGDVGIRQYSVAARLAGEPPCPPAVLCQVGVNFGVRQLALDPTPGDPGSSAAAVNHTSALMAVDVLGGYFFSRNFGVAGRLSVGSLLDAPEVRSGADSQTWGRPSLSGAVELLGRF